MTKCDFQKWLQKQYIVETVPLNWVVYTLLSLMAKSHGHHETSSLYHMITKKRFSWERSKSFLVNHFRSSYCARITRIWQSKTSNDTIIIYKFEFSLVYDLHWWYLHLQVSLSLKDIFLYCFSLTKSDRFNQIENMYTSLKFRLIWFFGL